MPQYYSKAEVDEKQKAQIYKIQADYDAQIDKLTAELTALKAKRDAEIRAVLTKEQQKKLDTAIEEAKKGKKSRQQTSKPRTDDFSTSIDHAPHFSGAWIFLLTAVKDGRNCALRANATSPMVDFVPAIMF